MVTSKQLPNGSVVIRPRRSVGGAGLIALLMILLTGVIAVAGIGLFAPTRLAAAHEQALGLLHGGVADVDERSYVDGCVAVEGAEGPRAVMRTWRKVSYRDGTTLEVVFSGQPAATNACP
jgi:hypothetical protein